MFVFFFCLDPCINIAHVKLLAFRWHVFPLTSCDISWRLLLKDYLESFGEIPIFEPICCLDGKLGKCVLCRPRELCLSPLMASVNAQSWHEAQRMESIKSPHAPALLFAGLHRQLWGTVTVAPVPNIANFAFTWLFPETHLPGEGNGNPLQCSCLENPRDRGVWWAAVYGVAQSQTRLKRLSSSSSYPQFTYKTIKINTYKRSIIEKTFIKLINIVKKIYCDMNSTI